MEYLYFVDDDVVFLPPPALLGWADEEKGCILGKHTTDGSWKAEEFTDNLHHERDNEKNATA